MFISVRVGICSGARRTVVCESQLAKMRVLLDYAAVKKGGAQGVRMIWCSIVKEGRWTRVLDAALDAGTGRGRWTLVRRAFGNKQELGAVLARLLLVLVLTLALVLALASALAPALLVVLVVWV